MHTSFSKHALMRFLLVTVVAAFLVALSGQPALAGKKTIRMADAGWDSIRLQNRIAGFILKNGLGHRIKYVKTSPDKALDSLSRGKIDVIMETWVENNQDTYDAAINSYKAVDLGPSLPGTWQGWMVPLYMVTGNAEKGIPPTMPGLSTVYDIARYWRFFTTKNNPGQGLFYGGVPGWGAAGINGEKLEAYGLAPYYDMFLTDTDADLTASLETAYKEQKPWFGYYWGPTWVLGKYDMVPLAEPPYDPQTWETTRACAYPRAQVNVVAGMDMLKKAPKAVAMLIHYEVSLESMSETLARMHDELDDDPARGAIWFLGNYDYLWNNWVPPQVAEKVRAALK